MRVGFGYDAHRFGGDGPLKLAGVVVAEDRGLIGTSDGDVAAHAVADALLGAAAQGDLGDHFPSDDPTWKGADSMHLLARVIALVTDSGHAPRSLDVTVIAQSVRISPHREQMRARLAAVLGVGIDAVSVKATSTDTMGSIGADEGIAATAVVVCA